MRKTTDCYSSRPYERTEKGLCYRIFYHQVKNSKARGHQPPSYTKEELHTWITTQPNFSSLYQTWCDSNYTTDLRPSCDRLDNSKGYTFDNIELVDFKTNKERAYADTVNGTLGSCQVDIYQYNTDGTFKAHYTSMNNAARSEEHLDQRNISSCCRGLIPTAYGYFWSYKDLGPKIDPIETNVNYNREIFEYCPYTGDLTNMYSCIEDITTDTNKLTNLRFAIKNKTHWNFKQYSFDFLSPEQLLADYPTPKQKHINIYKDNLYITTAISANKAKAITGVADTIVAKCCKTKQPHKTGYSFRFSFDDELAAYRRTI